MLAREFDLLMACLRPLPAAAAGLAVLAGLMADEGICPLLERIFRRMVGVGNTQRSSAAGCQFGSGRWSKCSVGLQKL